MEALREVSENMSKSLVIVESPAKAKTISKYLGKGYIVKSSVGHIRDLPKSGGTKAPAAKKAKTKKSKEEAAKDKLFDRMGVNPKKGWEAEYQILPGKEKVLKELITAAEKVDQIFLATDLDREGESIAWHLSEAIGGDEERFQRVTFTEITKKAIEEAFREPGKINMNMVYSQQARRFLDRVVGYMLSPLLWARVARGLSAGRVQSVAVRLISEREKEIHAFVPEEYWEVYVDLDSDKGPIQVKCEKVSGKSFSPKNETEASQAVKVLESTPYELINREDKPTKSKPSAPFITSTLQQAASTRLNYGVKKTMVLAQRLYEAGYITYMRTDSTHLNEDAVLQCRDLIKNSYGDRYLPDELQVYKAKKKGAQEAHEAIRPSDVSITPDKLGSEVEPDAKRLYDLIWRQFVACQMNPAEYDRTVLTVKCEEYELRCSGRVLRFDGYTLVLPPLGKKDPEDLSLPDLKTGDPLKLAKVDPQQNFTKPPSRFSEAKLVKELEKRGIGRPSTYASIISTIQDRGYVLAERRRFYCLKMGEIVTDRLMENFTDLMSYNFTANMEESLDKIAAGEVEWHKVLDQFYADFEKKVEHASTAMRTNDPTPTDIECPECGRPMTIRTARTGVFLSCSGYSLPPKERCKGTINLVAGEEAVNADESEEEQELHELQDKKRCPLCKTAMDSYLIDEARKLHVCGNNPDCNGFLVEKGQFKINGYEGPVLECDKCGGVMELRTGRFGKYFACTNAPDCKNTRKLLRNGEPAPPKCDPVPMPELKCEKSDGFFILRDGAAGIFLASNQFPKSRETKKPMVEDLVRHKDELPEKYVYLAEAPVSDDEGRPTLIRFARKTKEHYVMSEENGKPSGWSAHFVGGKWEVRVKGKS